MTLPRKTHEMFRSYNGFYQRDDKLDNKKNTKDPCVDDAEYVLCITRSPLVAQRQVRTHFVFSFFLDSDTADDRHLSQQPASNAAAHGGMAIRGRCGVTRSSNKRAPDDKDGKRVGCKKHTKAV